MTKPEPKSPRTIIILACIAMVVVIVTKTSTVATATPPAMAESVPSEVLQTIDAVHAAAEQKEADAMLAEQQAQPAEALVSHTNWQIDSGRILAVGTGVVIGMVAINIITAGATSSPLSTLSSEAVGLAITEGAALGLSSGGGNMISIYGLMGALLGGVAADYLYGTLQPPSRSEEELEM